MIAKKNKLQLYITDDLYQWLEANKATDESLSKAGNKLLVEAAKSQGFQPTDPKEVERRELKKRVEQLSAQDILALFGETFVNAAKTAGEAIDKHANKLCFFF